MSFRRRMARLAACVVEHGVPGLGPRKRGSCNARRALCRHTQSSAAALSAPCGSQVVGPPRLKNSCPGLAPKMKPTDRWRNRPEARKKWVRCRRESRERARRGHRKSMILGGEQVRKRIGVEKVQA